MNSLTNLLVGIIAVFYCAPTMATPITANSGASFFTDMIIAGGGPLPLGLEVLDNRPLISTFVSSGLDAPDSVEFEDSNTLIAGLAPDNPSIFARSSSSTRNLGTEGAFSSNDTRLYIVRELETVPDGDNDVSERGIWGEGLAQASISTEAFDTGGFSDVTFGREFIFANDNPFAMTFGIEGRFEMDLFAIADGETSYAESFASIDMLFSSSGILDIVFADTSPNIDNQTETGDNAAMSLSVKPMLPIQDI